LVIGISLLALFNFAPFSWTSEWVVFEIPAVILAQFMVACAFATRAMRISFDQIPERYEKVALTLGCNRGKAFWLVVMPQTRRGIVAAGTLAWARSLGEFGPILVFAGSTRMRTEVLPTSVYLEIQAGNLKGALAVSLIMIVAAAAVLATSRLMGMKRMEP
jgi:molybdate transport system permease protein